ncbi:MAG TPA: type II secretion system protein, partial [Armatimonadota bacterium]|nr:type II secretion system protein [Armatimonadota bacterium]
MGQPSGYHDSFIERIHETPDRLCLPYTLLGRCSMVSAKRGFTLIELLVVIAIIAILA